MPQHFFFCTQKLAILMVWEDCYNLGIGRAVLVAELVKSFHPRLVDLHNYR